MGKSTCTIGVHNKRTCTYGGVKGSNFRCFGLYLLGEVNDPQGYAERSGFYITKE